MRGCRCRRTYGRKDRPGDPPLCDDRRDVLQSGHRGLGKGHLVREVDALDGLMGLVADSGGIQFRMLNRRKGPAVRGPRAQADRKLYAAAMQAAINATVNLDVIEGEADELIVANDRVIGIRLADGRDLSAGAVVITTGTFLRGLIHLGERNWPAGRVDEAPAMGLSTSFERAGFTLGRLKTGTPPRLDGATIDWSAVEMQPGDEPPEPFSVLTDRITTPQIQCGITRTTPATHEVIRANVHRSPMYSGQIKSSGPVIVLRSKTRSFASATAMATRSSWSLKAWMTARFTPTASRLRCRKTCSWPFWLRFPAWSVCG